MPVNFANHIPALQARVVSRTAGLHLLDDRTVNIAGNLQLIALGRVKVAQAESPAAFPVFPVR
jgi:hypothetical protein